MATAATVLSHIEAQQIIRFELREFEAATEVLPAPASSSPAPAPDVETWHGGPQQPAEFLGFQNRPACRLCLRENDRFATFEGDDPLAVDCPTVDWPAQEVLDGGHLYRRVKGEVGLCLSCVAMV